MTISPSETISLHTHWYALARACDLRARPLPRTLLGQKIVLFRDRDGKASALLDHCPHRGYPLSEGSVVQGEIRCPYHGWSFDGKGACKRVPGLDAAESHLHRLGCQTFATEEAAGIVFVYGTPGTTPNTSPLPLPLAADPKNYLTQILDFGPMKCGAGDILENFMDSMHPPFVHGSFLNQDQERHRLELEIAPHENGIEGLYVGETAPKDSLALRLFAGPNDGKIYHAERYLLPTIHQFEYRIGRTHFVSTQFCSPVSETETRLITIYHIRLLLPRFVTRPLLWLLFSRLIHQDYRLLERFQAHLADAPSGLPNRSTELDALGLAMRKTLRELSQANVDRPPSDRLKPFRVPMWL